MRLCFVGASLGSFFSRWRRRRTFCSTRGNPKQLQSSDKRSVRLIPFLQTNARSFGHGVLVKILDRTLQLFTRRSPQTLQRHSLSPTPSGSSPLNVSKTRYSLDSSPRTVSSDIGKFKMAFSLGTGGTTGFGMQPQAAAGGNAQLGPELAEIQTQVRCCVFNIPDRRC